MRSKHVLYSISNNLKLIKWPLNSNNRNENHLSFFKVIKVVKICEFIFLYAQNYYCLCTHKICRLSNEWSYQIAHDVIWFRIKKLILNDIELDLLKKLFFIIFWGKILLLHCLQPTKMYIRLENFLFMGLIVSFLPFVHEKSIGHVIIFELRFTTDLQLLETENLKIMFLHVLTKYQSVSLSLCHSVILYVAKTLWALYLIH